MAGFANIKALVDAQLAGRSIITSWRKAPAVVTAAGYWIDLSMSPGNPKPNYYASTPLVGVAMGQSTDGGIFHGGAVAPASKHLLSVMAMTQAAGAVPLRLVLCDYLLYYPFIDEAATLEEQVLDFGVTNPATLPRNTDGAGVRMMAVVVAGHVGSPPTTFSVNYTNQSGASGRMSQTVQLNVAQFVNGTIVTSAPASAGCRGPFIPLQDSDTGVRSVQSVTVQSGGDVGLFTLVLVRPIADVCIRGIDAAVEVCFAKDRPSLPRVHDNSYLNWIALTAGSITGAQINGMATFGWSA